MLIIRYAVTLLMLMSVVHASYGQKAAAESPRSVISLNGERQIAAGVPGTPPADYPATIPVPGLVDMAKPPVPAWDVHTSAPEAYWYRRTFNIDTPMPAVAMLKINKAMYGSQVIVNGNRFEENWASYTPRTWPMTQV